MSISIRKLLSTVFVVACILSVQVSFAQETKPEPLFEYPQVPDKLTKINMRSNFMVKHLWDNCKLDKETIENVASFRETFTDYLSFFILADLDVVNESVKEFVDKVSKNETNFNNVLNFIDSEVYDTSSQFCSDDIYNIFARCFKENKRIGKDVKIRFETNANKLNNSKIGVEFANLSLSQNGKPAGDLNSLKSKYTIVLMNIDGDLDTSLMKLRLSTDVMTNKLTKNGEAAIISIYSDKTKRIEGDSENWYTAKVSDMENIYDMRICPVVYVLSADKKIAAKGFTTDQLLALMSQMGNMSAAK